MSIGAAIISLAICAGAAGLEGICAGKGVKRRMAELRRPSFSPPLSVWIAIGVMYYVACFVVLYQLVNSDPHSAATRAALVMILTIMVINALWNYLFFRRNDARASFLLGVPYALLVLGLEIVLFREAGNRIAAWVF